MSFLAQALSGIGQLRADVSGTPAPWDDFWYGPLGASSATGMRVNADTAKRVAAVFACVSKIGKCLGMFPARMYRQDGEGKQLALNHPLYPILYQRPNSHQTAYEFRQMMQGHLELRGNAYAEIVPGPRRAIDQLLPLHPDRVMVERLDGSGRLRYRYSDPLLNGETRYLSQDEMFHLRNWSDDGYTGQSTISLNVDVIGVALAAQDYYARFLKNDAAPRFAITGVAFKNDSDEEKFRAKVQSGQTGSNRHKAMVLKPGMDIKALGVNARDAELLDARKFSRIEICSIFDVPPHLIGEVEKTASYASVEQFNIMFATFCLLPRIVNWEQTIQRDLIFDDVYFPKFSMNALLRGDSAAQGEFFTKMWQIGVLSDNDIRIMLDLNPFKGGDQRFRPLNYAPLDDSAASSSANTITGDPNAGTEQDVGEQARDMRTQLALACMAAQPSVKREINAIRKLRERSTLENFGPALDGFYREHVTWLHDTLHLPEAFAADYCQGHRAILAEANGDFDSRLEMLGQHGPRFLGMYLERAVRSLPPTEVIQ